MTTLRPMREADYAAFFDAAVAAYAEDNAASGRWPAAEAPALARAETERLLPQGADTPDHHLHCIVDDGGSVVGWLWFAALPRGTTRVAYVYQLLVHVAQRRRGHGRAALLAAEPLAAALGLSGLALHVFASNPGAQALYRSLGYTTTSLNMHKPLSASP